MFWVFWLPKALYNCHKTQQAVNGQVHTPMTRGHQPGPVSLHKEWERWRLGAEWGREVEQQEEMRQQRGWTEAGKLTVLAPPALLIPYPLSWPWSSDPSPYGLAPAKSLAQVQVDSAEQPGLTPRRPPGLKMSPQDMAWVTEWGLHRIRL